MCLHTEKSDFSIFVHLMNKDNPIIIGYLIFASLRQTTADPASQNKGYIIILILLALSKKQMFHWNKQMSKKCCHFSIQRSIPCCLEKAF